MTAGRAAVRLAAAAALLALLSAAPARAGVLAPTAVRVRFRPGDAREMLVSTTFGLLLSRDGGASFHLVCPGTIGYRTFNPDYAIAKNGDIYASTATGLRRSDDGGCTWTSIGGALAGKWIAGLDIGSDGRVWAATADAGKANDVYVSDHGRTFASAGLHTEVSWFKTVMVAPSDPERVYATGYRVEGKPQALLFRSDDGGAAWKRLDVSAFAFGSVPQLYIVGVSPRDPSLVFARVTAAVDSAVPEDCMNARDALYRSTDAGGTWTKVLAMRGCINAFAIERDGRTAIAGTQSAGARISTDAGKTWSDHVGQLRMSCVGERSDGTLFACGANWKPDHAALSRSRDGRAWHELLRFDHIAGPLACRAGTAQRDVCAAKRWPSICTQLGSCHAGAPRPAPAPARTTAHASVRRGDKGCGRGCGGGCSIGLGAVIVVLPRRRRRRGARPSGS